MTEACDCIAVMRSMGYSVTVPPSATIPKDAIPVMNELPDEPDSVDEPEELKTEEPTGMDSVMESISSGNEAAMRESLDRIRKHPLYSTILSKIRSILDNKQAE